MSVEIVPIDLMFEARYESVFPWWRHALCAQVDDELFFPQVGASIANAKRICTRCPVRLPCLTDSLAHNVADGVYGGFGSGSRRVLRHEVADGGDPLSVAARAIALDIQRREATARWNR